MCGKGWFWPIVAALVLTAISLFFKTDPIEQDLTGRTSFILAEAGFPWAGVEADGRDLTITGKAPLQSMKSAAIDAAKSVYGVRVVADAITATPPVSPYTWSAAQGKDGITLTGHVPGVDAKAAIVEKAKLAAGGRAVTDNTILADGAPDAAWIGAVEFGLENIDKLDTGSVSLVDFSLKIEGEARDVGSYDIISKAFQGGPDAPDGYILANKVTLPSVSDYVWSAALEGGKLIMDGFAPDEMSRSDAEYKAGSSFPNSNIENRMKLAAGQPEGWGDAVDYALGQLSGLKDGKAMLSGTDLSLSGEAVDNSTYDTIGEAAAPEGFTLERNISRPVASPYSWSARLDAGKLVLSGNVSDESARNAMLGKAKEVLSGKGIADNMSYAGGAPSGFGDLSLFAISQLVHLEGGYAALSDTKLDITGKAGSDDAYKAVSGAKAPEGYTMTVSVEAPPPPPTMPKVEAMKPAPLPAQISSPYVWAAKREGGQITIAGDVMSEEAKADILKTAEERFPGMNINDNMSIAKGAPEDWSSVVWLALKQLGRLEKGQARLVDRKLTVNGHAASPENKEAIIDNLAAALPMGYSGSGEITAPMSKPKMKDVCQSLLTSLTSMKRITFKVGNSILTSQSGPIIETVADTLKKCPQEKVEIGGHTDPDGSAELNAKLSLNRARAVLKALEKSGINPERMTAKGYGSSKPVAQNDTAENKEKNRRIEFIIQ